MWGLSFLEEIMEREKLLEKWVHSKQVNFNSFWCYILWRQSIEISSLCGSIVKQGMLHSRGELLLMLDADGATKVNDLEKLENQVIFILILTCW